MEVGGDFVAVREKIGVLVKVGETVYFVLCLFFIFWSSVLLIASGLQSKVELL